MCFHLGNSKTAALISPHTKNHNSTKSYIQPPPSIGGFFDVPIIIFGKMLDNLMYASKKLCVLPEVGKKRA